MNFLNISISKLDEFEKLEEYICTSLSPIGRHIYEIKYDMPMNNKLVYWNYFKEYFGDNDEGIITLQYKDDFKNEECHLSFPLEWIERDYFTLAKDQKDKIIIT